MPGMHGWIYVDTTGKPTKHLEHLRSITQPPDASEGRILCITVKPDRHHRKVSTSADFDYVYYDVVDGKKICAPDVVLADKFSEGLASVQFAKSDTVDKYASHGYIDQNGNCVIKAQFSDASEFSQGLARVKVGAKFDGENGFGSLVGGKYGFIDKSGDFVVKPTFDKAGPFTENGLASIGNGFINKTGKLVITGKFSDAGNLVDGLAPAKSADSDKYGFIDTAGNWVQEPKWDHAESFSEGLAAVGMETGRFEDEESREWPISKWGFLDHNFRLAIPQKFLALRSFSEGLAAACAD